MLSRRALLSFLAAVPAIPFVGDISFDESRCHLVVTEGGNRVVTAIRFNDDSDELVVEYADV